MNFLSLKYHRIYNVNNERESGTIEAEQDRIQRRSVKSDAKKAYYADKEFFGTFTDTYIIEAVCQYFDMEDNYIGIATHSANSRGSQRQAKMGQQAFYMCCEAICKDLFTLKT